MRKLLLAAALCLGLIQPASAQLFPAATLFHPISRITAPLSSISDISVVADMDSTLSASYAGSGVTWSNLTAAPADGTTQSANNFGTAATFTGYPGQASAYFLQNGTNTNAALASGTNTAFLSALQNDTSSWWVTITFNLGGTALSYLWSTQNSSSTAGLSLVINPGSTPKFSLNQYTSANKQVFTWSPSTPATGVEYIVIVSHNAGGDTRIWFNSASNTLDSPTTFTSASLSASHQMTFGSRSGSGFLPSGSHISEISYGTGFLSNSQAGEIIHLLESRHQVDYDGNGIIGN